MKLCNHSERLFEIENLIGLINIFVCDAVLCAAVTNFVCMNKTSIKKKLTGSLYIMQRKFVKHGITCIISITFVNEAHR